LLLKHGADVHGSQLNRLEGRYNSPLAVSVRTNQPELFGRLIRAGADVNDRMYLTQDVIGLGATAYQIKVNEMHISPEYNPLKSDSDFAEHTDSSYLEFSSVLYFINHVMADPAQRAAFQNHFPDEKPRAS
ncbi:MAG: hypothetical protein R3194_11510, partial [Limnobacter sp.]|nr:hypothetical protein [Limnobacter sp.]